MFEEASFYEVLSVEFVGVFHASFSQEWYGCAKNTSTPSASEIFLCAANSGPLTSSSLGGASA